MIEKGKYIRAIISKLVCLLCLACSFSLPIMATPTHPNNTLLAASTANDLKAYADLWQDLSDHFMYSDEQNQPAVEQAILWYTHHPSNLNQILRNGVPFLYLIFQATEAKHMPAELALLPMIESSFHPRATSSVGASGLWQLRTGTARDLGLNINRWYDGRYDFYASTHAALNYMQNLNHYLQDWLLSLAAYNSGIGTVSRQIAHNRHTYRSTTYWQLHLPHETRTYVPRLLALAAIIQNPERYGVILPALPDRALYAPIEIRGQINLIDFTRRIGISYQDFMQINAGWRYPLTDPTLPVYTLLVPITHLAQAQETIQHWRHHPKRLWQWQSTGGNNCKALARAHHTHCRTLQQINLWQAPPSNHLSLLPSQKSAQVRITHSLPPRNNNHTQVIYAVSVYDNIDKIAQRFHVTAKDLCQWNHLKTPVTLEPLQQLIIHLPKATLSFSNPTNSHQRLQQIVSTLHLA